MGIVRPMFSLGKKPSSGNDWVSEASEFIETCVDVVRDKAVVPLTTIARAIVYGLLAGVLGVVALIILSVAGVRLLDIYLDNIPGVPENVWFAYAIAGAIFVIAGLLLWSKRKPKVSTQES